MSLIPSCTNLRQSKKTKKILETKKAKFRKTLKNLPRDPSKEAVIFSSVAHLVLKCYAPQDFLTSPDSQKGLKKF